MPINIYKPANVVNRNRQVTIGAYGHSEYLIYEFNGSQDLQDRFLIQDTSTLVGDPERHDSFLFTGAPNFNVTDTIRLFNDTDGSITFTMRTDGPLAIIADIIKTELKLDNKQVYIYNQEFNIPQDDRVRIAVGFMGVKPYSQNLEIICENDKMFEVKSVNSVYEVEINIFSKSEEALHRKEEVLLALQSQYSRSQQILNGMSFARIPTQFVNLSLVEGAAILFRFNILFKMHYNEETKREVEYFDRFIDDPTLILDR